MALDVKGLKWCKQLLIPVSCCHLLVKLPFSSLKKAQYFDKAVLRLRAFDKEPLLPISMNSSAYGHFQRDQRFNLVFIHGGTSLSHVGP